MMKMRLWFVLTASAVVAAGIGSVGIGDQAVAASYVGKPAVTVQSLPAPQYVRLAGYPMVYALRDNRLHPVMNLSIFFALGGQWDQVVVVSDLNWPMGNPVQLFRVAGTNPVYALEDGTLHWIPNGATFNALGLRWNQVYVVDQLPAPVGSVASPTEPVFPIPPTPPVTPLPSSAVPPAPTSVSVSAFTYGTWELPGTMTTVAVPLPANHEWAGRVNPSAPHSWQWLAGNPQYSITLTETPNFIGALPPWPNIVVQDDNPDNFLVTLWRGNNGSYDATAQMAMTHPVTVNGQAQNSLLLSIRYPSYAAHPWTAMEIILGDWLSYNAGHSVPAVINPVGQIGGQASPPDWLRFVPYN